MARNFRTWFRWLAPSWLLGSGDGEKVGHTIAMMLDASMQRARDGMSMRYPSYAGETALALHATARAIPRGRVETAEHYAQRLIAWRYPRGHRVRGSAFALLEQVSEYFGGTNCWTVDANGNRHTRTAAGVEAVSYDYAWAWDLQPASNWSRFWVVLDGSLMPPDTAWEDVQAIRRLMVGVAWRPAGTQPEWLVVQEAFGDIAIAPGEYWDHWSVNLAGTQLPIRWSGCRYWSLDPAHNNMYSGDPDNFAEETLMSDDTTLESGDPTSFPASAALPNGTTYAGDPTSFPTSIRLLDDGDMLNYD